MEYSLSTSLEVLPNVFLLVVAVAFVILEIMALREELTCSPEAEPGRGGFIPPRDQKGGYEYYTSDGIVYISQKTSSRYRVYIVSGSPPPSARLRKNSAGQYFTVRCRSFAEAEGIVDRAYRKEE